MHTRDRIAELVPRLRRYARALGSSSVSADRLVRATLERAMRELQLARRADGASDLSVWLFGLMHEAYLESAALETQGPAPQDAARGQIALRTFEGAIGTLAPAQREIFLLVTLEDMSYEDVAKTLDVPIGTVMSRLSRAREKLRLALMTEARLYRVNRR
jgi:RNA polymerase sigma factor (sigma-70 family)